MSQVGPRWLLLQALMNPSLVMLRKSKPWHGSQEFTQILQIQLPPTSAQGHSRMSVPERRYRPLRSCPQQCDWMAHTEGRQYWYLWPAGLSDRVSGLFHSLGKKIIMKHFAEQICPVTISSSHGRSSLGEMHVQKHSV